MALFLHELKKSRISLIIWTAILAFLIVVTVLIYPLIELTMTEMLEAFEQMGLYGEAFNIAITDFWSYFAIECGETVCLGGALFAAVLSASALSGEERGKTAEFLLMHPIKRESVFLTKLLNVFIQIFIKNIIIIIAVMLSVLVIGQEIMMGKILLLFASFTLLELQVASLCFCISSVYRGNGVILGLGIVFLFYFTFIIANISDKVEFLKYITPFGYADGAYIVANDALLWKYIFPGVLLAVVALAGAFIHYRKKDIK